MVHARTHSAPPSALNSRNRRYLFFSRCPKRFRSIAQHVNEPCEADGHRTVVREHQLDLLQPLRSQSNFCPIAPYDAMAEDSADQIADIVANDGTSPC